FTLILDAFGRYCCLHIGLKYTNLQYIPKLFSTITHPHIIMVTVLFLISEIPNSYEGIGYLGVNFLE
ncbi:MAG: hypothetical protein AAGA86_03730, partial [Bacteroidota bacterium]